MNLLLSNDDGVFSEGMHALVKELSAHHTVTVVAPDNQRSGAGHGITCVKPVRVAKVTLKDFPKVAAYEVDGTPADCVRIGTTALGLDVDVVVSGINHGANLGSDVFYSGTVGAAMEGAMVGKQSIAISCYHFRSEHFATAARAALWAVQYVKQNPLPEGMMLNVNAPDIPVDQIKGVKVAGLCLQKYPHEQISFVDPFGMTHFWMPLEKKMTSFADGIHNDEYWVQQGYVSVTPIHFDIACYDYMKKMDVSGFSMDVSTILR